MFGIGDDIGVYAAIAAAAVTAIGGTFLALGKFFRSMKETFTPDEALSGLVKTTALTAGQNAESIKELTKSGIQHSTEIAVLKSTTGRVEKKQDAMDGKLTEILTATQRNNNWTKGKDK